MKHYLFIGLIGFAAACNTADTTSVNEDEQKEHLGEEVLLEATQQPEVIYEGSITADQAKAWLEPYFKIKNALVKDNVELAQEGALEIKDQLIATDNEVEQLMLASASGIAATNNLAVQRSHFKNLSDSYYSILKAVGGDLKVYQQYCPMAFDGDGGYWISSEKEIRNPYFGDEMLTCGVVVDEF